MNSSNTAATSTTQVSAWDRFWFDPSSGHTIALVRIGSGLLLLSYLLSFVGLTPEWLLGGDGLLPKSTVADLAGAPWWQASIFDVSSSMNIAWLVCAITLAVLLTLGIGGRWSASLAFITYLMFVHRTRLVTGLAEPLLTMMLAYTIIAPGGDAVGIAAWLHRRKGSPTGITSWTNTLAARLVQVHLTGIVLMTVLNRLAGTVWWSGEAVWWLITRSETRLVDLTGMHGEPAFFAVNIWTHAVIAIELLAVVLLWRPKWRLAAAVALVASCASLVLLTGELPWCAAIAVACLSFLPRRSGFPA